MTSKQVILISSGTGPQSGKSTLKGWFMENPFLGGYGMATALALPLKKMIWQFLGMWLPDAGAPEISRMVDGDLKELELPGLPGVTTRKLMQTLGTEWRNLVDEQLWTKLLLRTLDEEMIEGRVDFTIIDDLRFRHELTAVREWCEENGVKLWHIRVYREANNYVPNHASETAVFEAGEVDLHLYNDGTKEEFLAKIPERLRGIGLLK